MHCSHWREPIKDESLPRLGTAKEAQLPSLRRKQEGTRAPNIPWQKESWMGWASSSHGWEASHTDEGVRRRKIHNVPSWGQLAFPSSFGTVKPSDGTFQTVMSLFALPLSSQQHMVSQLSNSTSSTSLLQARSVTAHLSRTDVYRICSLRTSSNTNISACQIIRLHCWKKPNPQQRAKELTNMSVPD